MANEGYIWNYLTKGGLNANAAAGVMGNLQQESSMNFNSSGGYIAQWGGQRLTNEQFYAANHHEAPNSPDAEMGYLMQEIKSGKEGGPTGKVSIGTLNAQPSPAAAALYFSDNFERPASWAANNARREREANTYYQEFTHNPPPADSTPVTGTAGSGSGGSGSQTTQANAFPTGNDVIQEINDTMSLQGFDIMHPAQSLMQDAGAIALRTVLVFIGLLFIFFALLSVVAKAGVVPIPV